MRTLTLLPTLLFLVAGCAGLKADLSADGELNEEYRLKKVYAECLKRSAQDGTDCSKIRSQLLEQEEWDAMDGGV